ncbi:hypothetical protein ACA910_012737 [Epithemia clementina (nom. ined.)]
MSHAIDRSSLMGSPVSSTSESTEVMGVDYPDECEIEAQRQLPHPVKNIMDDPPLERAINYFQKRESWNNPNLCEIAEDQTIKSKHTVLRLDDRFSSVFNLCDTRNLQNLRWKRFHSPVIIREDDNDSDDDGNQLLNDLLQTDPDLKSSLHAPCVRRQAWGWDEQATTDFVIQNIGFIHQEDFNAHVLVSL